MTLNEYLQEHARLLAEKAEVDESADKIRTQIDHAKAERHLTGKWADPTWYARANSALRHKARKRQELQNEISIINKIIKQKRNEESSATLFALLQEVLLENLPEDVAKSYVKEAIARQHRQMRPPEYTRNVNIA